jgi:hypothetical protein
MIAAAAPQISLGQAKAEIFWFDYSSPYDIRGGTDHGPDQ